MMQNLPDELLLRVEKPARYTGNEINMVRKNMEDMDVNFALCFPDVYDVGMSHLGSQILYAMINERPDAYCQRAYAPWPDMEKILLENGLPLFCVETGASLGSFDMLGFTLQYEMSYTNVLNMLHLSHVPLYAKDRGENDPIVCAGGPCAYNPEPMADIFDFFYIGEGEAVLHDILDLYGENKKNGGGRTEFLTKLLHLDGVYVPCFYDPAYHPDGTLSSLTPNIPGAPEKIKKVIASDLDKACYPEHPLVPLIETVHDRAALEVFRGCIRGCRFCQAGYVYRPTREKKACTLIGQAKTLIGHSGYEEISLVSLSTGDYTEFPELAEGLLQTFADQKVNLSLPSLRIDAFTLGLMEKTQEVRKSSLTFAPEAGTQRLRDVINKGITEEEILNGARLAFEGGWDRIKLYFMVGLPTETEGDLLGIVGLSEQVVEEYYAAGKKSRPVSVNVSASCFVPKPFTPFQWEPQDDAEVFLGKQTRIKKAFRKKQVRYSYHDPYTAVIEGLLARGDRRVAKAIVRAWELGARFDGWSEHFHYETWERAMEETGICLSFYNRRKRETGETLPWDHIDIGVRKEFFVRERDNAYSGNVTPHCRRQCSACGANSLSGASGSCVCGNAAGERHGKGVDGDVL